jgi:splicing factor 3B subunit 3
VTDTGFLVTTPTLTVGQLGDDALVQVHSHGIRHIRNDRRVSEWRTPAGTTNIKASCNKKQVTTALSSNEVVYFELDQSGNLNEFQQHKEMSSMVTCIALSPIPEGRLRAQFIAVGCADNTVRILSLDPTNCLDQLGMQALSCAPESLCLIEMKDPTSGVVSLFLNIGLTNGVLLRTCVDPITGALTDTRLRFLGSRPVKLFPITIAGSPGLLCLSSRPWVAYTYQHRYRLIPLSYETLEYGSNFSSEQCPEGMVTIAGNTLRYHFLNVVF